MCLCTKSVTLSLVPPSTTLYIYTRQCKNKIFYAYILLYGTNKTQKQEREKKCHLSADTGLLLNCTSGTWYNAIYLKIIEKQNGSYCYCMIL